MSIAWTIMIAGGVTLLWSISGLILIYKIQAEVVFPAFRPRWLIGLCWVYLTLALLAWFGLFQSLKPMPLLAVVVTTLTAAKFFIFYLFYKDSRQAFVLLWRNHPAISVILTCSVSVGALMFFIAHWVS